MNAEGTQAADACEDLSPPGIKPTDTQRCAKMYMYMHGAQILIKIYQQEIFSYNVFTCSLNSYKLTPVYIV